MNKRNIKLGEHSFVTKLAGFEHSKYLQHNATHEINEIPLIQGKNIKNGKVIYSFDWYITKKISDALPRSVLNRKCIIIPYVGSKLGELAIFRNDFRCHLGSNVAKVELTDDILELEYLYYYLKSSYGQSQLFKDKQGSAQPNITMEAIRETKVVVFDKAEQRKIASVLSSLDSKIELNNRINIEIETMAKTLYDYWFVQFDFPNAKGKPYKTTGGKMVWNEELKREIPDLEGWSVGTLLDIADYANGLPCQKFRSTGNEFLRVIKIREMNEGFTGNSELVRPNIPEKALVENGDVLFSWSASLEVKIWTGGKGALNQHIFKVTSNEYPKSFFYYQLLNYLQHFKMMAENRKTTMGHITQEHLQQSRIAIPPNKLTKELESMIGPIFSKKMSNEIENQKLIELRDWLLPMLMNGQVKVSDVTENELSKTAEPKTKYGK